MKARSRVSAICVLVLGVLVLACAPPKRSNPVTKEVKPCTDEEVVKRFNSLVYGSRDTWMKNTWLGISTHQNPNDVWVTQEIVSETKPDVIVECGTGAGGSAIMWAMILREVNPSGRVVTVDIGDFSENARKSPVWRERVTFLLGDSVDPRIVEQIRGVVAGRHALVILDSDHHATHVLRELEAYAPMLNVGDYIIVQDTNAASFLRTKIENGEKVVDFSGVDAGPAEAVKEFLSKNKDFEVDKSRERWLQTFNAGGFLRRAR